IASIPRSTGSAALMVGSETDDDEAEGDASPYGVVTDLLSFLRPFARHYRALGAALTAGIALEMIYNASFPLAMRALIDGALISGDQGVLVGVVLVLAVGGLAASAVGIFADYAYARLSASLVRDLRARMVEQLMTLSMRYVARTGSADVLQRFSSDVGVLEN